MGVTGPTDVVIKAGESDRPAHLALHDLGSNTAAAGDETLVDELLECMANGGPAQVESLGDGNLGFYPIAGLQVSLDDGFLKLLRQLVVKRYLAAAVEGGFKNHADILICQPGNILMSGQSNLKSRETIF